MVENAVKKKGRVLFGINRFSKSISVLSKKEMIRSLDSLENMADNGRIFVAKRKKIS